MDSENPQSKRAQKFDHQIVLSVVPDLETPPSAEGSPQAQPSLLLDTDSLAAVATRLGVAEVLFRLMVQDLTFSDFMREVLVSFLKTIKCEAGSILEVDHSKQVLFFRATAGQSSDRLSHILIPWGAGIVGHVAESRLPVSIQDANNDPRFLRSVSSSVGFQSRNLVAVPVVIRDQVFCVVELFNRIGKPHFDEQDLELTVQLAEMAAKAIEVRLMINFLRKSEVAA